jgi:hypothetical protein
MGSQPDEIDVATNLPRYQQLFVTHSILWHSGSRQLNGERVLL